MRSAVLRAVTALMLAAPAFRAAGYECADPCAPPDCFCPTAAPPGGLDPTNTPQIVLLTFDDSVTTNSFRLVQQVLTNHVNPNGHPVKATFFVSLDSGIDYSLVQHLHARGHEIAVHTMSHSSSTSTVLTAWRAEIAGCRKTLSRLAQVPESEIVGFRAPFLKYNNDSFHILAEQGLCYDASVIESPGGLSTNGSSYIWPYTLDSGLAQSTAGGSPPHENFPGLFEVPIWSVLDTNGAPAWTMDPPDSYGSNEVVALWKTNFVRRYSGNRAPFGIFLHATTSGQWLSNTNYPWRADALNEFVSWALSFTNVWFLTTRDLVDFMRNPLDVTAAWTSPPFLTVTNPIVPTSSVMRCSYPERTLTVCTSCPAVYPRTNTVYATAVATSGGVIRTAITTNGSNNLEVRLSVSNDTSIALVDWEAVYAVPTNRSIIGRYGALYTTTTTTTYRVLTIHPAFYDRPLDPGDRQTNAYFVVSGSAPLDLAPDSFAVYDLGPVTPELEDVLLLGDGRLLIRWSDSAYGYRLESATNLDPGAWSSVADVYGGTEWSASPTGGPPAALYRARTID